MLPWLEARSQATRRASSDVSLKSMATTMVRKVLSGLPAAREIAQYAASQGADLIVVGTHGYGPVRRLVLGSVADQVVRMAPCPVLMVPHRTLRASSPAWTAHEQEVTAS